MKILNKFIQFIPKNYIIFASKNEFLPPEIKNQLNLSPFSPYAVSLLYLLDSFLGYVLFYYIPEYRLSSTMARSYTIRLLFIVIPGVYKNL
jgi:hypothetical protein